LYTQVGFSVGFYDELGYYVDVICTDEGYGAKLLKFILKRMEPMTVSLSSLSKVLSYYPKFGFKYSKKCDGDSEAFSDNTNKELKAEFDKYKDKPNTSIETIINRPKVSPKIKYLLNHGFGNVDDKYVSLCNEQARTSKRITDQCIENGFKMKNCRANRVIISQSEKSDIVKKKKSVLTNPRSRRRTEAEKLADGLSEQPLTGKRSRSLFESRRR